MSSGDSQVALALAESLSLDERALGRLAAALAPLLGGAAPSPVAYTVATLALELGLSERVIRAAINRGELDAVKRGRTYLVSREAVEAWAAPVAGRSPGRERSSPGRAHRPVMASALARLDRER